MIKKRLRVSVRRSEYDSNNELISSLGLLTFFFKSVTYRPTLSKFRGIPVKKNHPVHGQNWDLVGTI